MYPARCSCRSGYQPVNVTSDTLIGQPATVSAIRYHSSGSVAKSHNRTIARTPCPTSHAADTTTNARRNVEDDWTSTGIGYRRWAYRARIGRPSKADPKNVVP